jgi:hypothetical protein
LFKPPPSEPTMEITTSQGRINEAISYAGGSGRKQRIPLGSCLVESTGGAMSEIIWGTSGQTSVALYVQAIESAKKRRPSGAPGLTSGRRCGVSSQCPHSRPWCKSSRYLKPCLCLVAIRHQGTCI